MGMTQETRQLTAEIRVPNTTDSAQCSTSLGDAGSYASIISLVGLIPILWAAIILIRERRKAGKANWLRKLKYHTWHLIHPGYNARMARIEDVMSFHEITLKLLSLGQRVNVVNDCKEINELGNAVLICAPGANKKSKEVLDTVALPITIDTTLAPNVIYDKLTHQTYCSPQDEGKKGDIAILAKVTRGTGTPCFLIWGLHGAGTIGAAKAFCDNKHLDDIYRLTEGGDFVSVLHVAWDESETLMTMHWLVPPRKI